MQIRIRVQHLDISDDARTTIERRLRLAIGRHAAGIDRALVSLQPPLHGGGGSCCRIRLRLRGGDTLAFEGQAEDVRMAADAALWRLEHRLERRRPEPTRPSRSHRPGLA